MHRIKNKTLLEQYMETHKIREHFGNSDLVFELVEYEKGEFLTRPDKPLTGLLFVVKGNIIIYGIREDSSVYNVTLENENAVLGDMEFIHPDRGDLYSEAKDRVTCVQVPYQNQREKLLADPVFLYFLLNHLVKKMDSSMQMTLPHQTLEQKLIYDLTNNQPDHTLHGVNQAVARLHCSRRQLQRVLDKLCSQGQLEKTGKGIYRLKTS